MITNLIIPPTSEPVSIIELKKHLKIDSGTMEDNFTNEQSIVPGAHAVTAGFTLFGSAVEVTGDTALVLVNAGACGAGGTVDVKIQESDTGSEWEDWEDGAFDAISEANDNQIHELEYSGGKAYIRAVGQVLTAACEFDATVTQYEPTSDEDSLLERVLEGARLKIEQMTGRQLESATWDYVLQDWPSGDAIKLPYGNLTSVTSVIWKDNNGEETTLLTETTDYLVETNGTECGRIVLPESGSWPSGSLYPSNPITIRFVCGFATVPEELKTAILFVAEQVWTRGEDNRGLKDIINFLTCNHRLWDEF